MERTIEIAIPHGIIQIDETELISHLENSSNIEIQRLVGHRIILKYTEKGKVKKSIGVITGLREKKNFRNKGKNLISVDSIEIQDKIPFLTEEIINVAKIISRRYITELFEVISLFSPPSYLKLEVKLKKKEKIPHRMKKLYKILSERKGKASLATILKSVKWEKLIYAENEGFIEIVPSKQEKIYSEVKEWFEEKRKVNKEGANIPNIELTDEQKKALSLILSEEGGKFLIHGVTGSGKTEVYLRAIEKTVSEGKGAIYLLPEISLTTFLLGRIKERFPDAVVLHSGIGEKEREMNWWALRYGISRVAIGARSCVFAPLTHTGIIIVDEEHDHSYKQSPENTSAKVFYDAREVAEIRAEIEKAKIIFGSATPSVKLFYRAKEKKEVKLIEMKKRVEGMSSPETLLIDLRESGFDDFLSFPMSEKLRQEIEERVRKKENIILLFTRRGWALSVFCESCSHKFKCKLCDTSLTYHRKDGIMLCHWCGRKYRIPSLCPECGSDNLGIIGFGTERIEEELKGLFQVPVFRMDSDVVKNERHAKEILERFAKTSPSILLGTQMVAKGFDFPSVTLVGVILADTEFMLPDFRADERAFQLITQVAGRAGRKIKKDGEDEKNTSIIQTFSPDYPVIRYAVLGDYNGFFEEEIRKRRELGLPPFRELVAITISGPDESKCKEISEKIAVRIKNAGLKHENPTKSARYFVGGKYNMKIPVYISGKEDEERLRRVFKKSVFFLRGMKITVDVNPDTIL